MLRILLLSVLSFVIILLVEAIATAQCRPGYAGSGYYRSSNCGEYLIPKADPLGGGFYSAPMIFPGPYGYGYAQPVIVAPPWAYRPWYFEPPQPYMNSGSGYGYYPAPPTQFQTGVRGHRNQLQLQSGHRGFREYNEQRSEKRGARIARSSNGVWTNE
jgi:hypothetical protein